MDITLYAILKNKITEIRQKLLNVVEDATDMNSRIVQNTNNIEKKLDKNQGASNSGKITGINESGDIVPMFPQGVTYNEKTQCLEYGADEKLNLNVGIQLDDTLSKVGYAADAASVGELKGDLVQETDYVKEDVNIIKAFNSKKKLEFVRGDSLIRATINTIAFEKLDIKEPFEFYFYYYDVDVEEIPSATPIGQDGWFSSTSIFSIPNNVKSIRVVGRYSDNRNFEEYTEISNNTTFIFGKGKVGMLDRAYVSIDGNDSNIGDINNPFKTISCALEHSRNVFIEDGTYNELINISDLDNISISAINDGKVTIQSGNTVLNVTNIDVLNVSGINFVNTYGDTAKVRKCKNVHILNCDFSGSSNGNGLSLDESSGVIDYCNAHNVYNDGFNIHTSGCTVFNFCNAFNCTNGDGISHHEECTGIVNGGRYYNNGKAGIATPTYGAKVDIYNVMCYSNQYGLQIVGGEHIEENDVNITLSNSVIKNNDCGILIDKYHVDCINCVIQDNIENFSVISGSYTTL